MAKRRACLGLNYLYLLKLISSILAPHLNSISWCSVENILYITLRKETSLLFILRVLKDSPLIQAKQLLDLWGVDTLSHKSRFIVNYLLVSLTYGFRIIIKVPINASSVMPTAVNTFSSANWLEREVWDMFGIFFAGHPDLRRILTDYGFDGFPLRKDFPLTGYTEVRYDEVQKKVVQEPIEITQEFRYFDYNSPWERI